MAGLLFIISAPSGSGKSTLVTQLRTLVEGLDFSISYTTRAPRGSEEDGREYHFTSRENFQRMVAADEFLEWAEVFGNYYGTARSALEHARSQGKDLLLDIDVQGAMQVIERHGGILALWTHLHTSARALLQAHLRPASGLHGLLYGRPRVLPDRCDLFLVFDCLLLHLAEGVVEGGLHHRGFTPGHQVAAAGHHGHLGDLAVFFFR